MALYAVAQRLGRTVAELQASMSAQEFARWCIFLARQNRPAHESEADEHLASIFPTAD